MIGVYFSKDSHEFYVIATHEEAEEAPEALGMLVSSGFFISDPVINHINRNITALEDSEDEGAIVMAALYKKLRNGLDVYINVSHDEMDYKKELERLGFEAVCPDATLWTRDALYAVEVMMLDGRRDEICIDSIEDLEKLLG